jgi:hypothetical protein
MSVKAPVYWKQRNGVLIDINLMDVNHLRNVLKMIVNNSNKRQEKKQLFTFNGDMAQEFHESYLSDENDDRFDATEINLY